MKHGDFEEKMENLRKPAAESVTPPPEIKLAIINAQRSASLGWWFVAIPYVFIAAMIMKFEMNMNLGVLDAIANLIGHVDGNPMLWWIQPFILLGLPLAGIILNTLAITHFKWEPSTRSLIISLKIRWVNIIVVLISLLIISIFALYLIGENFQTQG